ncbi:MAG: Stp1/IreP family PP2C-type Ser/Thr phosphatase [Holdemanella sp.]|nr:Stp1/IreP family PP2C-type Ser/Thr phosphatase [Holdemanella sp.]
MKVYAKTDRGLTREVNEDDYCIFQNKNGDWLALVCDGIGGSAAGEVASHICVSTMRDAFLEAPMFTRDFQVKEFIQNTLNVANDRIYQEALTNKNQKGMGTTAVGLVVTRMASYIFNVGDSRVYADYSDGLIQMSEDHSVIAQLIREGRITPEQAKTHPQKNTLTNALGVWHVFRIDINKIQSNYKFVLLCSDGLHGYVNHEEIQNIVENPMYSVSNKVDMLIMRASQAGGFDNCTVILLEKEQGE